jgi:hypothetical protein
VRDAETTEEKLQKWKFEAESELNSLQKEDVGLISTEQHKILFQH